MLNPQKKRKECYFAGILAATAAISLLSGCGGGTPSLEEALVFPPRLRTPLAVNGP